MTSSAAQHPLTSVHTRITITGKRHAKTKPDTLKIQDALDFWSFAGAAANVVMQLGRPEVAYGVMESRVTSGSLMHHPWKRARTTVQYLAVALLGSDEERAAYRDAVNSAHRQVQSTSSSPVKYNAFNRELQMWVAACLFVGFEDTYQLLHGKLDPQQADEFYRTSFGLGTTLQVLEEQWPRTRADFENYWNDASQHVVIDDTTSTYLNNLIDLKMIHPLMRWPFAGLLRFLTIGFLPPLYRTQLGLEWTDVDRRRFENLFAFVSVVNKFIPRQIRFFSSYALMWDLRRRIRKNQPLV